MKEKDHRPHIVIIIDEFSDLMMTLSSKKQIESCITKLGQKAKSVGIHMVLSTKKVDVQTITELVKSHLPSRIAFSMIDAKSSDIVLSKDGGANNLIGKGDMIYHPKGEKPCRIQGGYISESNIDKLITFIIDNNRVVQYDDYLMKMLNGGKVINNKSTHPCWIPLIEDVARKSGWNENSEIDAVEFINNKR